LPAFGDIDEISVVDSELMLWQKYVSDNKDKSRKIYDAYKGVRIASNTEIRIAENAIVYAAGGGKVGSIIANKIPNVPGIDVGVSFMASNIYDTAKDYTEIYNDEDIAVIFVEGHRAKLALDTIGDLYSVKALDKLIDNAQIFVKNPGPYKSWKHANRGFDY
jgi:hypothetical protein